MCRKKAAATPRSIWAAIPATSPTRSDEIGKAEFDYHLTKSAPALCIDCHDVKDASLQKAHHDQPFGTADCTTCHDPHQSALAEIDASVPASAFRR